MQTGILLGLAAALCWGVADFCARGASRAGGTFTTLLAVQVLGILGLLAFGLPLGLLRLDGAPLPLVLAAGGISLLIMVGAGLLYRAFAVGTLALVSPIAAAFAAITALLAMLSGEHPSSLALAGIILAVVGVVVVSAVPEETQAIGKEIEELAHHHWRPARGLLEAVGAMLTFGVGYWLLRFVTSRLGGVTVAFIGKLADFIVLASLAIVLLVWHALARRQAHPSSPDSRASLEMRVPQDPATQQDGSPAATARPRSPRALLPAFWLFVVPTGLLDTAANVAYNVGITVALTSVVVVLSSLFSAVTVLLAWIFLHERLARWQWLGVAAILVGVLLVNL